MDFQQFRIVLMLYLHYCIYIVYIDKECKYSNRLSFYWQLLQQLMHVALLSIYCVMYILGTLMMM